MAILSILAAIIAPVFVKSVDQSTSIQEGSELTAISNALVLQIVRSNNIPGETTWSTALTNWVPHTASQILTNSRYNARLFFYDQGGWLNGKVPWTNTAVGAGSTAPTSARIAIVSSIGPALPFTNGALPTVSFDSIWNASKGAVPSYLASLRWGGAPDDLTIQRVSLDQMFHHLILTTRDHSTAAGYTINSTALSDRITVLDTASGLDSYYLDGTTVNLWDSSNLTNSFILTRDLSLTFDGGMWQAQLTGAGQKNSVLATNFAYQASLFIQTAKVPGAHQGADTEGLLSAFYSFLYGYTIWGNECPHFQSPASSPGQQTDYLLLNALGANNGIIDSTASSSGGGLLK